MKKKSLLSLLLAASAVLSGAEWNWQGEEKDVEIVSGNPSELKLSDGIPGKTKIVKGKDGAFTVLFSGKGGILRWDGKPPEKGELASVKILRFEQTVPMKGWAAIQLQFCNEDGFGKSFNLGKSGFYLASHTPRWKPLGYKNAIQYPAVLKTGINHQGQMRLDCGDKNIAVFPPEQKPFRRLMLHVCSQRRETMTLLEFAPVVIEKLPKPLPPKPRPTASMMPRIIMAHSMICFPAKYDGVFRHAFFENAPLIPDSPDGSLTASGQFFRDMKEGGIDAVNYCFFAGNGPGTLENFAESARKSGSGVKVLPCMDDMGKNGETFLARLWEYKKGMVGSHPNILRTENGYPVIITYGSHPAEAWKTRIENYRKVGAEYMLIGDLCGIEIAVLKHFPEQRYRPAVELLNGMFYFGSATSAFPRNKGVGIGPAVSRFAGTFREKKVVGGSVSNGYFGTTRVGNLFSSRGTYYLRMNWLEAIRENFDFINLTTNNDYTETEMECSANSTFGLLDMNRYFGDRWRTGKWPELKQPRAVLSYRKAAANSEKIEFELVLFRPDVTGKETSAETARKFQAECSLSINDGEAVRLSPVAPVVLPGHIVWRFWASPLPKQSGYANPYVKITENGKELFFPKGRTAAFTLLEPGELMSRKWLHVPLHRINPAKISVAVDSVPGKGFMRRIRLTGLPEDRVMGGILELSPDPFTSALSPAQLKNGWLDPMYPNGGFAPMRYQNHWSRRCYVDRTDRYMGVVRFKDNTFAFAKPFAAASPRPDPATVVDFCIGDYLTDKVKKQRCLTDGGPLQRHWYPPKDGKLLPEIRSDLPDTPKYLHFRGREVMNFGSLNVPPGPATLELWLRLRENKRDQIVFSSWGGALNTGIDKNGKLYLGRTNQARESVRTSGNTVLPLNQWLHIAAVYDGERIQLYLNGRPDGDSVESHGLRTDEKSAIGGRCGVLKIIDDDGLKKGEGALNGDIGMFRLLGRPLSPAEIQARAAEGFRYHPLKAVKPQ